MFGRGFGRGFGRWWAYGPYGYGGYPFWGGGRGNPFPFCRNFPWLPRWWWASPNASQYANTILPYGYGDVPDQFPYSPAPGQPTAQMTPEQELDMLKGQTEILEDELDGIRKRIKEIESSKTTKK